MKVRGGFLPDGQNILATVDALFGTVDFGIYVSDYHSCELMLLNSKMAYYLRASDVSGIIGKPCWKNLNPGGQGRCPFCPYKMLLDQNGEPGEPYIWEMYLDSLGIWLRVTNQAAVLTDGRLVHIATFLDISEIKLMREQLGSIEQKDILLDLKNDIALEHDTCDAAVKPSLILLELLTLQRITEAYGREKRDFLRQVVCDKILSRGIPNSELYSLGVDRFCVATGEEDAHIVKKHADALLRQFSRPQTVEHDGSLMRLFHTAGVAVIPGIYIHDGEPLLSMIEIALKKAKNRKRVTVYNEKMDKAYRKQLRLEWSLKRCVHENMRGFNIHYQPIVDSASGAWCGLEALCRWRSPELGPISPLQFIPEAERLDLISPLGLWVLESAISKCKEWGLDKCEGFILDVNVSAIQFLEETLAPEIVRILQRHGFPGEKLCLEITESARFTFLDRSLATISQLRAHKILVALDDFGTGYSNFLLLKNLPVDIVKTERTFVADIESDAYHQYLFHAMVELAHTANMKLIAEGVENSAQMNVLTEKGADCLQGYLFSKPMPPCELEKKLNRFFTRGTAARAAI